MDASASAASGVSVNVWTHMWAEARGVRARFYRELESTNDQSKNDLIYDQNVALSIVTADHQTHGRGRGQNTWQDLGAGKTLLCSFSLRTEKAPQPIFPPLVGLALYTAAREIFPRLDFSLKAPNDLMIGGQKVAGLLVEAVEQGPCRRAVVGLGMNVWGAPEEHLEATSLAAHFSPEELTPILWGQFLDSFIWHLEGAMLDGVLLEMTEKHTKSLLEALNRNKKLEAKWSEVARDGSLRRGDDWISWSAL